MGFGVYHFGLPDGMDMFLCQALLQIVAIALPSINW